MTVYLEVFVLQNLAMNGLILTLALRLAGRKLRMWRLLLSAFLGTAYACLSCLIAFQFLRGFICQVLCILCMCLIALHSLRPLDFLRLCGFAYVATALLGGTGFGLMGMLGSHGYGPIAAILTALIGAAGIVVLSFPLQRPPAPLKLSHRVTLSHHGTTLSLDGFTDTGNALCEPLSGLPVMLLSEGMLQLPEDVPLRPVPYEAMGQKGIVDAFFPEQLLVDGRLKDWYVAVYPGRLPFGALLPFDRERDEKHERV